LHTIENKLLNGRGKPSNIETFKEDLSNNLFYNNSGMARFLLIKVDSISHNREYEPELWEKNDKGFFVWTIEHIFPQTENITQDWINMVGDGDIRKAEEVREKYVHCLGNLTLSGYNSKLSKSSFHKKQSKHEDIKSLGFKINIGYKNGLALNNFEFEYKGKKTNLAKINEWKDESIVARNDEIVNTILKLYHFDFEKSDLERTEV